jgi:hypothetical protein
MNVAPLVDVVLVLLIIFMVTAPFLQGGLDIDLPKVSAQGLDMREGKAAGRHRGRQLRNIALSPIYRTPRRQRSMPPEQRE